MGLNLDKIDKNEVMTHELNIESLGDIEEELYEASRLGSSNCKHGILECIITKLIRTGRFKFKKLKAVDYHFPPCKETKVIRIMKRIARGVITCRRLKVVARQATIRMQLKAKQAVKFNDFVVPTYNEEIRTISADMWRTIKEQEIHFDQYVKNEATAYHLADI